MNEKKGDTMSAYFNWSLVGKDFPRLVAVLPVTLMIVLIATIIGLLLGSLIAFLRIERIPVLSQIAAVFVSFVRGTPILVQLYIVYYGVPILLQSALHIDISGWNKVMFVYIAYGLNTAAFQSETIRASIQSIPRTQTDACIACGLTKRQTYMKVIFPQMIRVAMPSFGTTTIALLQDTSLAFTIGVVDVVGRARALGAATFHTMEAYAGAAVIFVALSFILERVFAAIERNMSFTAHTPHIAPRLKMPSLLLPRRANTATPTTPAAGLQIVAQNAATVAGA